LDFLRDGTGRRAREMRGVEKEWILIWRWFWNEVGDEV
jgi:hypothetical protein